MPTPDEEQDYLQRVRQEIKEYDRYSRRQLRLHRLARMVVIVSALAVSVLASWSEVPRAVLAAFAAVAAGVEAVAQLFQLLPSALAAMNTRNALEHEVNLFLFSARQYAALRSFPLFVDRVERIRQSGEQVFHDTWQKASVQRAELADR
jgi:hypothetical protein